MGRDAALPRLFAHIHPRFRSPDYNVLLTGAVMLIGLVLDLETATSCVNFGAFTAYTAVNLCVALDEWTGRRQLPGGSVKVVQAMAGAAASIWLLCSLQRNAIEIGFTWFAIGCVYLALRRGRTSTESASA
jgi:putrescine importer